MLEYRTTTQHTLFGQSQKVCSANFATASTTKLYKRYAKWEMRKAPPESIMLSSGKG